MEGDSTARFCGDHKGAGMVDVKNKRCVNTLTVVRTELPLLFMRPSDIPVDVCLRL